jgi:Tol biopolymer transport system component
LRTEENWKIWSLPEGETQRAKTIRSGVGRSYGLNWTPAGRIVFAAMARNKQNIFRIDADGSNETQLTTNGADNYMPASSSDGRYVIFSSNRSGSFNIWRMNAEDGSELQQLTFGDGNFYPSCSPDGWVVYDNQTSTKTTIWKVPIAGGDQVQLTNKSSRMPIVSPDSQFVAYRYYEPGAAGIEIMPLAGGPPVKRLRIPIREWQRIQWSADSRALTYIDIANGVSNIWSYDLQSGLQKQVTEFGSDQIFAYAWSPDYKLLAIERGSRSSDVVLISNP